MSFPPLSERQATLAALADALAARNAERAAAHDRDGAFPHASYTDMHQSGYLRQVIPTRYGGAGASVLELAIAQERLARGDGATALAAGMLIQLIGKVNEEGIWPEPVFAAICHELATKGGLINSVVTEPELGSVSRGGVPRTTAIPAPGGWRVSGHKIFATGGPALRFLAVGVIIPALGDATPAETATAIVRADAPGVQHTATWGDSMSMRTAGNDDFAFEEVFVPDEWLVGRRPLGTPSAPGKAPGMSGWSLPIAAVYLGIGQAACDAACDYAINRRPSSLAGSIAELPHIQQWIGRMQVGLDAARAVIHATARAWDEQPELRASLGAQVAGAKFLATTAACEATELALRVAGGFSLTRALPLERYFRDARAGLFNPPQDDLALAQVGRAALALRTAPS